MKNKLTNLNNHLFEQLERLNDESLKGEKLEEEIKRSQAVSAISKDIVSSASLELSALKLKAEYQGIRSGSDIPEVLRVEKQL